MHDLLARYALHLIGQRRIPAGQKPFPRRYKAQIVQPSKLPYAVRHVQRREIANDPRRRAANYPFSSSLIYSGRRPQPACFAVESVKNVLKQLGYLGSSAYFEFMAASDSPSIAHLLSRRIIGDTTFVGVVRARGREPANALTPDELLREISGTLLHIGPHVASSSTHRGALARALIAWYAMRTGSARIGTVARWFGVTGSDLRYLIRRHRRKTPNYFCTSLRTLFPALPTLEESPIRPSVPMSGPSAFHLPRTVR
jgi:hypothetical protein